jgi:hypothetical protein
MRCRPSLLNMHPLLITILASLPLLATAVAAQTGPPRLSPRATVYQVGNTELEISYCRPAVRGRQIWGALVPYDKVWRTGANEVTTFKTSSDVKIEGKPLAAGTYALVTIPRPDRWTLIFNKDAEQWGAFDYDEKKDVLRVDVKPVQSNLQERMEFLFDEFNDDSADVVLRWEQVAVPFTVTVDTPKVALAKAEQELAGTPKAGALTSWARWFQEHGVSQDKALAWEEKALAMPDGGTYWAHAVHARLLAAAGKNAEAKQAAQKALEAAKTYKGAEPITDDMAKLKEQMASWG